MTTKQAASDQQNTQERPKTSDAYLRARARELAAKKGRSKPEDIARWERDYECVKMRRANVDWDTIVEKLGYASKGHAHNRFVAFMRAYPRDDVETLRDLELDRIERVRVALEPRVNAGDPRAAEVWNKLSERLSKLCGLDKPERKEVTVLTEDAVDHAIRQAREEMEAKARAAGVEVPQVTV